MTRLEQALERARERAGEYEGRADSYSKTMLEVWRNQMQILEQQLEEFAE